MKHIISIGLLKNNNFLLKHYFELETLNDITSIIENHYKKYNVFEILGIELKDIFEENDLKLDKYIFYYKFKYCYVIVIDFENCYLPNGCTIDWKNNTKGDTNLIMDVTDQIYDKYSVKYLTYSYFDDLKLVKRSIFVYKTKEELEQLVKKIWTDYNLNIFDSIKNVMGKLDYDQYCMYIDKYNVISLSINFKKFYIWSKDCDPIIIYYNNYYKGENIDMVTSKMEKIAVIKPDPEENVDFYKEKCENELFSKLLRSINDKSKYIM